MLIMKKVIEMFIVFDRWLNYLSGGSITNTISGRIGYYSNHAHTSVRWFWVGLQSIVDVSFYPMDGWNHCHDSYHRDKTLDDYTPTKRVFSFFLLSLFTVGSCIILIIPFYILLLIGVLNKDNL